MCICICICIYIYTSLCVSDCLLLQEPDGRHLCSSPRPRLSKPAVNRECCEGREWHGKISESLRFASDFCY